MTDWTDCAIKRDDAERIAREHVVASGSELSYFTFSVRTLAEVRQQRIRTPWIYNFPDESLATVVDRVRPRCEVLRLEVLVDRRGVEH